MIPSAPEIARGLYGAWRLLLLDRGGAAYFDASLDGVWKSFFAAVLVAPIYALVMMLQLAELEPTAGPLRLLVIQAEVYVISWVAFPLVVYYLALGIGRRNEYPRYIVAFNWARVLEICIELPYALLRASGELSGGNAQFLLLVITVAILGYKWFVARVVFDVGGFAAVGIVLLDFVIFVLITSFALGMMG